MPSPETQGSCETAACSPHLASNAEYQQLLADIDRQASVVRDCEIDLVHLKQEKAALTEAQCDDSSTALDDYLGDGCDDAQADDLTDHTDQLEKIDRQIANVTKEHTKAKEHYGTLCSLKDKFEERDAFVWSCMQGIIKAMLATYCEDPDSYTPIDGGVPGLPIDARWLMDPEGTPNLTTISGDELYRKMSHIVWRMLFENEEHLLEERSNLRDQKFIDIIDIEESYPSNLDKFKERVGRFYSAAHTLPDFLVQLASSSSRADQVYGLCLFYDTVMDHKRFGHIHDLPYVPPVHYEQTTSTTSLSHRKVFITELVATTELLLDQHDWLCWEYQELLTKLANKPTSSKRDTIQTKAKELLPLMYKVVTDLSWYDTFDEQSLLARTDVKSQARGLHLLDPQTIKTVRKYLLSRKRADKLYALNILCHALISEDRDLNTKSTLPYQTQFKQLSYVPPVN